MTGPDPSEGVLAGAGGNGIYWRSWAVPDSPRAVVVLVHGFGEHSGRYERIAERLQREGYEVYALDHQGHGRSAGSRGAITMTVAVADLDQLVVLAQARRPDAAVILLGHSMGGAIAIRYAIAHGDRLTGLSSRRRLPRSTQPAPLKRLAGRPGEGRSASPRLADRRADGQPRPGGRRRLPVRPARVRARARRDGRHADPPQ